MLTIGSSSVNYYTRVIRIKVRQLISRTITRGLSMTKDLSEREEEVDS